MKKGKLVGVISLILIILAGAKFTMNKHNEKQQKVQEQLELQIEKRNVALQMDIGNSDMDYSKVDAEELQVRLYAYYHDTTIEITLDDVKAYIENNEYGNKISEYIDWSFVNTAKRREYLYSLYDIAWNYIDNNIKLDDSENFKLTLEQIDEFEKLYRDSNYVIDNKVFEGYGQVISK